MSTIPDRPLRICTACGQVDDHPRHEILVPAGTPEATPSKEFLDGLPDGTPASAIALLLDGRKVSRHLDCCAAAGCVVCAATEVVTAGVRGQELIDTIADGVLDGFEPPEVASNVEFGLTEAVA